MSLLPIQPDDEMLSAYIDGELAMDELRAVEAWTEGDPAARATLDELRSVSSAVQALPRASVPAEWTAKLAERLDDARGSSTPTTPSRIDSGGDAMPSLPFGRTSRGWWWSATAIAAAVAIMLMVPRDAEVEKIARNTPAFKPPASGGEMVMSAPNADNPPAPPAPALGSMAEAPATAESAEGEGIDALAMDAAAPATMSMSASTPEPTPEVADFAGVAAAPSAATTMSAGDVVAEGDTPADNAYLIVWCDVPPETLRGREINDLLVDNGIVVDEKTDTWLAAAESVRQQIELRNSGNYRSADEPIALRSAVTPAPEVASSRFAVSDDGRKYARREARNRGLAEEAADAPATEEGAIEALADVGEPAIQGETILVDATADQIAGCLAAMQQDPSNFKSITVEPVSEMAIAQQLSIQQRSLAAPVVADSEKQVAQESVGLSRQAAQARRLARPEDWYFYNAAPKEAQQGYRLPMLESKDGKAVAKSEDAYGDKQQQLAELNRYVAQQPQQQAAGRVMPAPLVEQQPVQVLFVLRNSLLPEPVAASDGPVVQPASESPSVEAADTDAR